MKKALRLIGMGLMALVVCGNFAACSSDDDDDNGGGRGGKRIVAEKGDDWRVEYKYDGSGRVVNEKYYNPITELYEEVTYEYGESAIKVTGRSSRYNYTDSHIYDLKDGRITRCRTGYGDYNETHFDYEEEYTVAYSGNRMKSITNTGNHETVDIVWEGNNIKRIGDVEYTYYSDKDASKGNNNYEDHGHCELEIYINDILYRTGFYGECSQNLTATIGGWQKKYEFDEDDYVVKEGYAGYDEYSRGYEWK